MSIYKTKFFGHIDIDDSSLQQGKENPICINNINTKINLKGECKDIIISFVDICNYINFGHFSYNTYLDYINRFIKLLDQYPYLYNIGKMEIIKSYCQKGIIMERYNTFFSDLKNSINEILIKNSRDTYFRNIVEELDIKKIVKMANPPDIGLGLDKNRNILAILQYNLAFIGIVSIKLDEHLKLYSMGHTYFRSVNTPGVQYQALQFIHKNKDSK
jgi:hypothetical protein